MQIALYFFRLISAGGAERRICTLANELVQCGIEVHLISLDPENAKSYYMIDSSVTWHKLGFSPGVKDKFRRIKDLTHVFKAHKISLLIGFVISSDKTIFAAVKLASVKLIVAERNSPSMYGQRYGPFHVLFTFTLLRSADLITVQFHQYIDGYPAYLRPRITAIPNPVIPVNTLATPSLPLKNGKYTLLTACRFDDFQKNISVLVNSFHLIEKTHPQWDLVIFGDGPDKNTIQQLISQLNLSNRVFLKNTTSNIDKEYCQANLFVIPSNWEGFPNSLSEALSHGLPAIGFQNADGVSHLIEHGISGWLAEGLNNVDTLASTLSSAMTNHTERKRRGKQAIKTMQKYSPTNIFDRWVNIIHKVNKNG